MFLFSDKGLCYHEYLAVCMFKHKWEDLHWYSSNESISSDHIPEEVNHESNTWLNLYIIMTKHDTRLIEMFKSERVQESFQFIDVIILARHALDTYVPCCYPCYSLVRLVKLIKIQWIPLQFFMAGDRLLFLMICRQSELKFRQN